MKVFFFNDDIFILSTEKNKFLIIQTCDFYLQFFNNNVNVFSDKLHHRQQLKIKTECNTILYIIIPKNIHNSVIA